eukprot:gene19549-38944_t
MGSRLAGAPPGFKLGETLDELHGHFVRLVVPPPCAQLLEPWLAELEPRVNGAAAPALKPALRRKRLPFVVLQTYPLPEIDHKPRAVRLVPLDFKELDFSVDDAFKRHKQGCGPATNEALLLRKWVEP